MQVDSISSSPIMYSRKNEPIQAVQGAQSLEAREHDRDRDDAAIAAPKQVLQFPDYAAKNVNILA